MDSSDVLFAGKGPGTISWYRAGSPAFHLGCDWVGLSGRPPNHTVVTGLKRGEQYKVDLSQYKIVILQQVAGLEWQREIVRLKRAGAKVFYEIDDHIQTIRKMAHHRAREYFSKKTVLEHELCMRVCDGLIVSTPYLARRYRKFNAKVYVCQNFIETDRYKNLRVPQRRTVNIGLAVGEGHAQSAEKWLPAVNTVLDKYPNARFLSIGLPIADLLRRPEAISLPYTSIENFPAALCNFDIAIAPAQENNFFRAKSDLRFLEAGAVGIPCVAHPLVYGDSIQHKDTGILAESEEEVAKALDCLVKYEDWRLGIGENARQYVYSHRSTEPGVRQWEEIFAGVADGKI